MTQESFNTLREKYPCFVYEGYTITSESVGQIVAFHFSLPQFKSFVSKFVFQGISGDETAIEPLVARLGMIEALSYWKATCSPVFKINTPFISAQEIPFWEELYFLGLGEFRYVNKINSDQVSFVKFELSAASLATDPVRIETSGNLIPVGGGKDSIVTLELLSESHESNQLFFLNPREACYRTAKIAGYQPSQISVCQRILDSALLELNKQGFLNGHTPFSALLAFTSLIAAALVGKHNIVLSNEGSASEGNIASDDINHQFSKSFHFEEMFRSYQDNFLTQDINYFSLLRPLHEVQIAALFSQLPQYFEAFRSCNVGCFTDSWCQRCPKCLFTALILKPFISAADLGFIFGSSPLDNLELKTTLLDLCLPDRVKPFECVGSREESLACANLIIEKGLNSALIESVANQLPAGTSLNKLLKGWGLEHVVPTDFTELLRVKLSTL